VVNKRNLKHSLARRTTFDRSCPFFELKALPSHLKYQYLGEKEAFPVIIASHLTDKQEDYFLAVLRENREAIGWTMADIKGISLSIVQHRIHLIEEAKTKRDPQRQC